MKRSLSVEGLIVIVLFEEGGAMNKDTFEISLNQDYCLNPFTNVM